MRAPAMAAVASSPLSRLAPEQRALAISTISARLSATDAVAVLTALAGSRDEVAALPWPLQRRAQEAVLHAFPPGLNALVVSRLGIALVPTAQWLPEIEAAVNAGGVDAAMDLLQRWAREQIPPDDHPGPREAR